MKYWVTICSKPQFGCRAFPVNEVWDVIEERDHESAALSYLWKNLKKIDEASYHHFFYDVAVKDENDKGTIFSFFKTSIFIPKEVYDYQFGLNNLPVTEHYDFFGNIGKRRSYEFIRELRFK